MPCRFFELRFVAFNRYAIQQNFIIDDLDKQLSFLTKNQITAPFLALANKVQKRKVLIEMLE